MDPRRSLYPPYVRGDLGHVLRRQTLDLGHRSKVPMVRRNAERHGTLEGGVGVMVRLIIRMDQRRPSVGAEREGAVTLRAARVEEPLAGGKLRRHRTGIDIDGWRASVATRGE